MSATSVFRDYLFYNRWGRRAINLYFNTMILFVLVGLWHGINWYWTLWGALHGIGFCIFLRYKKYRQGLPPAAPERSQKATTILSSIVTYVFICLCWALPTKLIQLLHL